MKENKLPLIEKSIRDLFCAGERSTFEIPVYQRNYSWGKDQISALIQDIYDASKPNSGNYPQGSKNYYIGTLVSFHHGGHVYEVIDGQQRLTTIRIILSVMGITPQNKLTFRARKKSDDTINSMPLFNTDNKEDGIFNGYNYASDAYREIVLDEDKSDFITYFLDNVKIIQYIVPKDVNLNQYFEVMNSRGEQLEKHEIIKAQLMGTIEEEHDRIVFNRIWECCSEMNVYTQQLLSETNIYGKELDMFLPENFSQVAVALKSVSKENETEKNKESKGDENDEKNKLPKTIEDVLNGVFIEPTNNKEQSKEEKFQPITDFPNFLLIVLKIMMMKNEDFIPTNFILDDKFLLQEFKKTKVDAKEFAYTLLKTKYLIDNYIVHHSIREDEKLQERPWLLQKWQKKKDDSSGYPVNIGNDDEKQKDIQKDLVQILSMFEVSFSARQRKNYLFYSLLYLFNEKEFDIEKYDNFLNNLADRYFACIYLEKEYLSSINTPIPRSFDNVMLRGNKLVDEPIPQKDRTVFTLIYGDGTIASKGVPIFVFNYMDYQLWKLYATSVQGQVEKKETKVKELFEKFGCPDFGLRLLNDFYFSRTRRSLEHFYAQALATGEDGRLDQNQINCFGNFAMIGSAANSSGSYWFPKGKLELYLDASHKISQVSVASLKFAIMMKVCEGNNGIWEFKEIKEHQEKMMDILGL